MGIVNKQGVIIIYIIQMIIYLLSLNLLDNINSKFAIIDTIYKHKLIIVTIKKALSVVPSELNLMV
ncbi:hypothetical protein GOM49_04460 [Clostridium bovifaecis]|uniref:Uncharacterized protein n=1 Tax=Clostridium bovifaecis TaxID=2184719 RepID=A0A6I6EPX8_9CLOT|nr:hypothetical protein GOM49_04460 [Clostridium bovifaecis]